MRQSFLFVNPIKFQVEPWTDWVKCFIKLLDKDNCERTTIEFIDSGSKLSYQTSILVSSFSWNYLNETSYQHARVIRSSKRANRTDRTTKKTFTAIADGDNVDSVVKELWDSHEMYLQTKPPREMHYSTKYTCSDPFRSTCAPFTANLIYTCCPFVRAMRE